MPTSTTETDNEVIHFHQKRRERIIKEIIRIGGFPEEQIDNIIKMHTFLIQIEIAEHEGSIEKEILDKIETEIEVVREKFEELFEMMKDKLFIRR